MKGEVSDGSLLNIKSRNSCGAGRQGLVPVTLFVLLHLACGATAVLPPRWHMIKRKQCIIHERRTLIFPLQSLLLRFSSSNSLRLRHLWLDISSQGQSPLCSTFFTSLDLRSSTFLVNNLHPFVCLKSPLYRFEMEAFCKI